MQGRWAIGLVLVVLAMLVPTDGAMACSCAPQAPAEALEEADAAIVGRLVKVLPRGALHADYRYEVLRVYRGQKSIDAGRMLTVRSARRAAACALPRRTDHNYGLFLSHSNGRWFGGICGVIEPRRLRHAARNQAAADSAGAPVQPVLCG